MRNSHQDYKICRPELEEIKDYDGSTILISPLHSKYKELKMLEESREGTETDDRTHSD